MLFAYLVCNRFRAVARSELVEAVWPGSEPDSRKSALTRLLTKLRHALGEGCIEGRENLHLVLPPDASVDVEAAESAIYSAEAALSSEDWPRVYSCARITLYTCERGFLPGFDAPWVAERRAAVEELHLRALECAAATALAMGGSELPLSEKHARRLTELAPRREIGRRLLMETLAARGNVTEALRVHADYCRELQDELGTSPGAEVQALHRRLLEQQRGGPVVEGGTVERTFMFTDIVGSTALVALIGDEAWRDLLSWHDEMLRGRFADHGGEEVDHAGDGFFVAFEDGRSAIECAVAIQRCLLEHRRSHGFAPQLRIGLHAAGAAQSGRGYRGKGVHEAARIGALAGPGEIVASRETVDGAAGAFSVSEPRSVELQGISDAVEVVAVDWR
jgi:class 3 adenylate cyclase